MVESIIIEMYHVVSTIMYVVSRHQSLLVPYNCIIIKLYLKKC